MNAEERAIYWRQRAEAAERRLREREERTRKAWERIVENNFRRQKIGGAA